MATIREDDNVVVQKSSLNVAGIIAALALLLLVFGVGRYFHVF